MTRRTVNDSIPPDPASGVRPDAGPSSRPWFPGMVIGLVLLLQVGVTTSAFYPAAHNGGDNAGYLTLAHSLAEHGTYQDLYLPGAPPHTKYPPLYPAALAVGMKLGLESWISFKAFSALLMTLAVLFAILWGWERRGLAFGAGIGILLAVAPAFLWASNWILSDPLFLVLTFASLWAFERWEGGAGPFRHGRSAARPGAPAAAQGAPEGRRATGWLVIGGVAAILAYFTRSAGLPLVVAGVGVLALRRRWRAGGALASAFALPAFAWWLRNRGAGAPGYLGELLLVDPYRPDLGRAGVGDFVSRIGENLHAYVGTHIPEGLIGGTAGGAGAGPGWHTLLGYVLVLLAVVGWGRRAFTGSGRSLGVAELFAPLYLGLLLVWPVVWGGDRFALPLYLLVLAYGGESLLVLGGRLARARTRAGRGSRGRAAKGSAARGRAARGSSPRDAAAGGGARGQSSRSGRSLVPGVLVSALALFLVFAPALAEWSRSRDGAEQCAEAVRAAGPFACYGGGTLSFVTLAEWAGANLPDSAVVATRKPRIFYVQSGLPSVTIPFRETPQDYLAELDSLGATYLLFDAIDGISTRYTAPAVRARPDRFCHVYGFEAGGARADLFGVLPEGAVPAPGEEGQLAPCPPAYRRSPAEALPPPDPSTRGRIPLLRRPAQSP